MKLGSDTKAVLRELRRHHREMERQLTRIANACQLLEMALGDAVANETTRKAINELEKAHPE